MAQQDAMEQVKEVVRQIIKYRFWISVGFAALFGIIAYLVGASPVRAKAEAETKKIKDAETEVKQYASTNIPTKEYQPIVEEKTQVLTRDVNKAWKTLYDRQSPLLTWPDTVQDRFQKWGRKWPETEDRGKVNLAIVDYIMAYKEYVTMVYKTFKPFDFESGEGIVVSPPEEALLRPSSFSTEHLPGLSAVWSAQERLWIQRTVLEVVAQVNKNAKDWSSATVRQIEAIEVGSPVAQDQRSMAHGDQLAEAPLILAPGETAPDPAGGGGGGASGAGPAAPGGAAGRMGMMMGGGGRGMGGPGGASTESQSVFYVKAGNENQYKILPLMLTVLIDQDHVQDLLIELENSPMSIEVKEFELRRPPSKVSKPEKGASEAGMGMGMGMSMGMGMMGMMGRRGTGGFGGMADRMGSQMSQMMMMQRSMGMGQMGMGMGGMGGAGASQSKKKGTDVRKDDRKKKREEAEKAVLSAKGPSLFDAYFDIVEVTVYGQARFFNPPPAEAQSEPSLGEASSPGAAPAATTDASAKPAEAAAPAPKGEAGEPAKSAPPDAKAAPADAKGSAAPADAKASPAPGDAKAAEGPATTPPATKTDGPPAAAKPAEKGAESKAGPAPKS
jgi:hypothetical protein